VARTHQSGSWRGVACDLGKGAQFLIFNKFGASLLALALIAAGFSNTYKIKSSDNDYVICHHFHITLRQLHEANPDVDWNRLRPGKSISIPGSVSSDSDHQSHSAHAARETRSSGSSVYRVQGNDTDYTIAKKAGVSLKEIHRLNPDVDWNRLGPGKKIHVPDGTYSASTSSAPQSHRAIRTIHAVVDGDNVHLRRDPSLKAETVTTVNAGTLARILERKGHWYELKFPKGTVAWVKDDYLRPAKHIYADDIASRAHRSSDHHRTDRYIAMRHSRRSSYSRGDYVYGPSAKGSKVISTAYAYRGTPYVWGGTSRSGGFDCSGFTSAVYRRNGVTLPRTSREQSEIGQRVSRNQLHRGDLVFFKTTGNGEVSHVGIYVGSGKFIHASSGGHRVMVSSLGESYYSNRFAGARRVVQAHKRKTSKYKK